MGRSQRKRSGSGNSYKELNHKRGEETAVASLDSEVVVEQPLPLWQSVREWMHLLLTSRQDGLGKSVILHQANNFPLLVSYWTLARKLDHFLIKLQQQRQPPSLTNGADSHNKAATTTPTGSTGCGSTSNLQPLLLQEQMLLERDVESQYTALHSAIYRADLPSLLFLLRHAAASEAPQHPHSLSLMNAEMMMMTSGATSFNIRPMTLLEYKAPTTTTNQKNHHKTSQTSSSTATFVSLWQTMVTARDGEGYTPSQLLSALQCSELRACRASLQLRPSGARRGGVPSAATTQAAASGSRVPTATSYPEQQSKSRPSSSFSSVFDLEEAIAAADQDANSEFRFLHQHLDTLSSSDYYYSGDHRQDYLQDSDDDGCYASRDTTHCSTSISTATEYGCEVLTFGRAHHCALGVGTEGGATTSTTTSSASSTSSTFRPQRVQAFAQSEVGRKNGAVAVAAAAHHTLVLNKAGQLYAFGLGKGGRLGIGNHERHSPLPALVCFPNHRRCHVIAIAAAENHSLAVVQGGQTYAWGSNRFGQLGISTTNTGTAASSTAANVNGSSSSCAFVPRRVDDLKDVCICAVAAGERHSVALSSSGSLYVWGDNSSGQLGVPPGHGSGGLGVNKSNKHAHASSSSSHNPVQRVDHPAIGARTAVAIAASEYATLVLTLPHMDGKTLPVNSIFAWGHGNHVPSKVHLPQHQKQQQQQEASGTNGRPRRRSRGHSWNEDESMHHRHHRLINPIAIACAKYHNVAITENGLVYSWGFHAETLGNTNNGHSWRGTTPQLVTGMLPEQGGGWAVEVSASENHTAVVTDTGALYTWGATHGPSILGHEGVRWQPNPKKVPGLYRVVAVAAAKEHFVVLSGTTFPPTPRRAPVVEQWQTRMSEATEYSNLGDQKPSFQSSTSSFPSLEELAAQQVTKYVDMFNVWPILITAERVQNETLIRYCHEFCKCNLDGVLNVGQRSVMDCYLTEQLQIHGTFRQGIFSYSTVDAELARDDELDADWHPILRDFCKQRCNLSSNDVSDTTGLEDWMVSCSTVMQSRPGQVLLQKLRLLQQINTESMRHSKALPRKTKLDNHGSMKPPPSATEEDTRPTTTKENESAFAKSRRGVSFGKDRVVTVSSKGSPRCMELTSNLLGDNEKNTETFAHQIIWLEERQEALRKEIRALRKRLSQISKLEDPRSVINSNEEDEGCRGALLPEQHEKVGRKALLQADLNLLEPALSKVTARLEELQRKQQPPSTANDKEAVPATGIYKEGNSISESKTKVMKNFRCILCEITCSDESSYSLHMNGRKHRNRVTQAEQEERERKAALVVAEQHQKALRKKESQESRTSGSKTMPPTNPWKISEPVASTPQPVYKLPPPPHEVPSTLAPTNSTPGCSLLEIMAAEEKTKIKSGCKDVSGNTKATILHKTSTIPSSAIKTPQSPVLVANVSGSLNGNKKLAPSTPGWALPIPALTSAKPLNATKNRQPSSSLLSGGSSWNLKVDALPVLDSPPWASAPVERLTWEQQSHSPSLSTTPSKHRINEVRPPEATNLPSISLGSFITIGPASSPPAATSSNSRNELTKNAQFSVTAKTVAWASPAAATPNSAGIHAPTTTTKLLQIQDEELAFKEKQDAAYGETQVVWFVERRERAGSLKEIQRSAQKEREHRLLVEEQFRIEQMIQEDKQRAQRQQEQAAAKIKNQKKKHRSHQRRGKGGGGGGGGGKVDTKQETSASAPTSLSRDYNEV